MSESDPQPSSEEIQKQESKRRYILLAEKLNKRPDLPFPGIDEESLKTLRTVEQEYPDLVTPVDVLVDRMNKEGIKVLLGEDPKSGNVFVLPAGSDDTEIDSLFPRHLKVTPGMDEQLQELILTHKASFELEKKKKQDK